MAASDQTTESDEWIVASDDEVDDLPVAGVIDERGKAVICWPAYYRIRKSEPELIPVLSDLKLLLEDSNGEEAAFALRWLTGWPAVIDSRGDIVVRQPNGVLWDVRGPYTHPISRDMPRHPGYRFDLNGYKDAATGNLGALCRDLIRSLGDDLRPYIINLPEPSGPSYAQRDYAKVVANGLGIPLPDVSTREAIRAFLDEHVEAYKAMRKAEGIAKSKATRDRTVAERLAAGLPPRRPTNPLRNSGKIWTSKHLDRLQREWASSKDIPRIALALGRTEGAVAARLEMLRILTSDDLVKLGYRTDPAAS